MASAIENPEHSEEIYTLNFYADWSDVSELMGIAIIVGDICPHEDFIFASGETTSARALVKSLFAKFGLDYRNHMIEKNADNKIDKEWRADISKMEELLGCRPRISIYDVCLKILESKYGYDYKNIFLVND